MFFKSQKYSTNPHTCSCGHAPSVQYRALGYYVACRNCGCYGESFHNREDAIGEWNFDQQQFLYKKNNPDLEACVCGHQPEILVTKIDSGGSRTGLCTQVKVVCTHCGLSTKNNWFFTNAAHEWKNLLIETKLFRLQTFEPEDWLKLVDNKETA